MLASPLGGRPAYDPGSTEPPYDTADTHRFLADPEAQAALATTVPLSRVTAADFDALFYPGGHGAVWDLPADARSVALIEAFAHAGKPTAFVCHAPAVLRDVRDADGAPLVQGRRVTGFSNAEEAAIGLTEVVPFLVEDSLVANGGLYSQGDDWASHVVQDGTLITGQNPESSAAIAQALLAELRVSV